MTAVRTEPASPQELLEIALTKLEQGAEPQRLIDVAVAHRDRWARLVEEQEAGAQLDGRANIYTGETYAQARDRWDAYRGLLVRHLGGPDGGGQ